MKRQQNTGRISGITLFTFLACLIYACPLQGASQTIELHSWEYLWEDIPEGIHNGAELTKIFEEEDWRPIKSLKDPPGREEGTLLWLRTKLPEVETAEASVYIPCVSHNFWAYNTGKEIYRFGKLDPKLHEYRGRPWHIIHLRKNYSGTYLYLRISSFDRHIGISGTVTFGPASRHRYKILEKDFFRTAVSFIFLVGGVFLLIIYMGNRKEPIVISFCSLLILMALWNISNSKVKLLYLDRPLFWLFLEHASLYFTPVAIGAFMYRLFGKGILGLIKRGLWTHFVYAAVTLPLSAFNSYWLRAYTLRPFQVLFTIFLLAIFISVFLQAWQGDIDARIITLGLAVTISSALFDMYVSFMGLSFITNKISYWGLLVFLLANGIVLDRRIRIAPVKLRDFRERFGTTKTTSKHNNKESSISPEIKEKLDKAIAYIDDNYTEQISREGLASLAGMNHDYFGKLFLAYTGEKVGSYISELRIKKAAEQLVNSDTNIIDIAFSSGFESISTFYRKFQQVTGLSPAAYRHTYGDKT